MPLRSALQFCDNKAAVLLSEGNTSSKRMRHVATQIAFLREQVKDTKRVRLIHIRTHEGQAVADLFTKPLEHLEHLECSR